MTRPIRILQVLSSLDHGGAQSNIMNVYRNIDRQIIQFDFVVHTQTKGIYEDEVSKLGGRIFRIIKYEGYNHMKYKKMWMYFLDDHKEYHIIHSHIRSTASIFLNIAKKKGLITVVHSHNTSSGNDFKSFFKNIMQYRLRYDVDYLLACSDEAGEWLYGKQVKKNSNYFVIDNGIDSKKYIWNPVTRENIRSSFKIRDHELLVGHVGRFHLQKNHNFIIEIFKELKSIVHDARLILVGTGELFEKTKDKIMEVGLQDSVIMTGARSDIPELMQAIDVLLFPSLYEGLPLTLIEAQAAGLPCVVSSNITKKVAITDLITFMDLHQPIREWCVELIKSTQRKRKCMNNELLNSNFDINNVVKIYEYFYQSLLQRHE